MSAIGAWEYWIRHDGRVRQIMVAEPQDLRARDLIQGAFPNAEFLKKKPIPESATRMLSLQPGWFSEAFSPDGEPDPSFGFPMEDD
jgi:hypothetical protein